MAKEYKLPAKGETMDFKGLYWEDMTDEQKEAYEEYCIKDIKLESHLFCEMFKLFSRPEIEIHLAHHTLELYTRPQLVFDKELGKDLIIRMRRELNTSLERTGFTEKELSGDLSFAKIMIDAMPEGETIPLKKGKPTKNMIPMTGAGMIPAFAKDDEGMIELQHHPSQQVRNLANARIELNSWPNWIKRLKSIGIQSKLLDSHFPIPLVYYGGHTGRGSGTEKINVQNLGAAKAHKLVQMIRHTMRAPEGSLLCISDLSAIEARMLAWMAQEQQLLDIYYINGDVYIAFASKLFKCEVTKKDNPIERGVGKTTILGCGYGMGWKTFLERLVVLPELQSRVMMGEINKAYSKRAIDTYRTTYQRIPDYWAELESAFRWVTKYPRKTREVHPGLRLWCEGHLTHIKLPNDRILYYPQSRVKATYNTFGDLTEQIRWKYGPTWGGSLTENVDQALARDILMEALLRWEQTSKYRVALHVHDELMSVVPKEDAEEALAMLNKCMTVVPKWAEGLPLNAEGFISEYYKK
jgi:DNA polymerase